MSLPSSAVATTSVRIVPCRRSVRYVRTRLVPADSTVIVTLLPSFKARRTHTPGGNSARITETLKLAKKTIATIRFILVRNFSQSTIQLRGREVQSTRRSREAPRRVMPVGEKGSERGGQPQGPRRRLPRSLRATRSGAGQSLTIAIAARALEATKGTDAMLRRAADLCNGKPIPIMKETATTAPAIDAQAAAAGHCDSRPGTREQLAVFTSTVKDSIANASI